MDTVRAAQRPPCVSPSRVTPCDVSWWLTGPGPGRSCAGLCAREGDGAVAGHEDAQPRVTGTFPSCLHGFLGLRRRRGGGVSAFMPGAKGLSV